MPRYIPKEATDIWNELKSAVPKLQSGEFRGDELISFTTTEDLTDAELATIEKETKKKWKKAE